MCNCPSGCTSFSFSIIFSKIIFFLWVKNIVPEIRNPMTTEKKGPSRGRVAAESR